MSNGLAFHIEGGLAWLAEGNQCLGVGAETCKDLALAEGMVGPYFSLAHSWNSGEEHSSSAVVTYSFEYTTSDDIEKAGNRSDMFLTPSLNVKFAKSADISFDKAACSAAYKEIVTWSLDSESNVPVCDFFVTKMCALCKHSTFLAGVLVAQCGGCANDHHPIP
jgi:hypothetical protein